MEKWEIKKRDSTDSLTGYDVLRDGYLVAVFTDHDDAFEHAERHKRTDSQNEKEWGVLTGYTISRGAFGFLKKAERRAIDGIGSDTSQHVLDCLMAAHDACIILEWNLKTLVSACGMDVPPTHSLSRLYEKLTQQAKDILLLHWRPKKYGPLPEYLRSTNGRYEALRYGLFEKGEIPPTYLPNLIHAVNAASLAIKDLLRKQEQCPHCRLSNMVIPGARGTLWCIGCEKRREDAEIAIAEVVAWQKGTVI